MGDLIPGNIIIDEIRAVRDELREFRKDISDWQLETAERLSKTETQIHSLVGNGQPGEVQKIKDRVSSLENDRWRLTGLVAGAVFVFGVCWEFIRHRWFNF